MQTPPCPTESSATHSVAVGVPVAYAWRVLAVVANWPMFSPFAQAARATSATGWVVTSPQGDVLVTTHFREDLGLLDHTVTLHDGTEVLIPYRVAPNHRGTELIMTNIKSPGDSDEAWVEQVEWMYVELANAKRFLEDRYAHDGPDVTAYGT